MIYLCQRILGEIGLKYFRIFTVFILMCLCFSVISLSVDAKPEGNMYTITYSCGNNIVFSDKHADTDEFLVKESKLSSLDGQRFAYWVDSLSGVGTTVYPYDVIRLDHDITLYAVYDSTFYRVTYVPEPIIENDDDDNSSDNESSDENSISHDTSTSDSSSESVSSDTSDVNTSKPSDQSDISTQETSPDVSHDDTKADISFPDVNVYTKDDTIIIKEPDPIKGYDFVEWNTKPDGTGVSYYPGDKLDVKPQSDNITLYPIFRKSRIDISVSSASAEISDTVSSYEQSKTSQGLHDPDDDIINKHLAEGDVWLDSEVSIHDIDKTPTYDFNPSFAILSVFVVMILIVCIVFAIVFVKKK